MRLNKEVDLLLTGVGTAFLYNPTMGAYQSNTTSRATYFTGVFDKTTFEHLPGEVKSFAFDNIKDFVEEDYLNISTLTLFPYENYFVFGYYHKKDKKYYFRKFED